MKLIKWLIKEGRKITHKEAVEEMKKLAAGRAWAFQYEVASYYRNPQIHGYIAGIGHAQPSSTYAGAINNVRMMLGPSYLEPSDPAPEDEDEKGLKQEAL